MRLKFIHNPFKDAKTPQDWCYGRGTTAIEEGEGPNQVIRIYGFRGLLDADINDIREVIQREESAHPDD